MSTQIWIVDFGSQYTQLITRKIRELGQESYIYTLDQVKEMAEQNQSPKAIVLSGGPQSVFEDQEDYTFLFEMKVPTLGVCYGMQLMAQYYGGTVEKGQVGEYGKSVVKAKENSHFPLKQFTAWMSHSDHVSKVPEQFEVFLTSDNDLVAGMKHNSLPLMAFQFHPEVEHTENGKQILKYFLTDFAKLALDWQAQSMYEQCLEIVKEAANDHVLCAFSGGVDSLVAACLTHQVLGEKLYCFFVDHGLLRPQDLAHIQTLKENLPLNIEVINAQEIFLSKLKGISDPEQKRKIIGNTFIEVFEQKVHEFEKSHGIHFKYLLQGTLYPDVIESISPHKKGGKSVTIKSHHNVGGLPERMNLKLLEPFRTLFKDEVRAIGRELKLEHNWVYRHPFPGPGLGVRILGEVTAEAIRKVGESDQILFEELHNFNLYQEIWQAFTVLLPVKTVGVKGDGRAYEEVIVIRLVNSVDGMTAKWSDVPYDFLAEASSRITNEVRGVTRVVYDVTSKPPGTIEWE